MFFFQICLLFKNREFIKVDYEASENFQRKRQRFGKVFLVEGVFKEWFIMVRSKDILLLSIVFQEKAILFVIIMQIEDFNFIVGWLYRWK